MAVVGLTPQVITETLHFLTQVRRPRIPVAEIWVLTTAAGRDRILSDLLDARRGAFHRFCRDYRITPGAIQFGPERIRVLTDARGRPVPDVRTEEDNAALADQIVAYVRDLTAYPETILHCSVAGGRKTMGLYLGFAMTLFGRPKDTLSHVLVESRHEADPRFFYPPPWWPSARQARAVQLATIPFVRLREKLGDLFGEVGLPYAEMVRRTQGTVDLLDLPILEVAPATGTIRIGGRPLELPPQLAAFYSLFAIQKAHHCRRPQQEHCWDCRDCFFSCGKQFPQEKGQELLDLYRPIARGEALAFANALSGQLAATFLQQLRSKANRLIRRVLGVGPAAAPYEIAAVGRYAKTHGLLLDKTRISVTGCSPERGGRVR